MKDQKLLELGQKIKAIREAKALTQHELANKAGVDRNYVGMLERGERNPSYLSLLKIAKGLNVSLSKLMK